MEEPRRPSLLLLPSMLFLAVYMLPSCRTCVIYVKTNKSCCVVVLWGSTQAFRALGRLDGKVPSQRSGLLPPSWEKPVVLTPTEGCETTSSTQWARPSNNGHTHTYCCVSHPRTPPSSTDGWPSSLAVLGVHCGLAGLQTTAEICPVFPSPGSPPYLMSPTLCRQCFSLEFGRRGGGGGFTWSSRMCAEIRPICVFVAPGFRGGGRSKGTEHDTSLQQVQ